MPTRVFRTVEFSKFARKARIDDAALIEAVERAERGLIDADLGGGLVKLRVARPNEGRRGGYRTIVAFVSGERAFFLFGYAKNDLDNIGGRTLVGLREDGAVLQRMSEDALNVLVSVGELLEIVR